jgi:AbiJ N-terminal domain 4
MAIFKLFSTRQKEAKGEIPDIFTYGVLPNSLRVQIVHILNDAVGEDSTGYPNKHYCFTLIRDILRREHALFELINRPVNPQREVINYFLELKNDDKVLDVVDLAFRVLQSTINKYQFKQNSFPKISPSDAIEDLNQRFKQHGIGYQFESGTIIRVDTQLIHNEVIKPALQLLSSSAYKGANEEFLKAHEHYKHDRYQECLVDALKALESVIKSICDAKGWTYKTSDSIKNLLGIIFDNELLPAFMESEFSALRGLLEGGTSVVRNKLGGHGQGAEQISVPGYWARYALNTAASNILLLVEAADGKNR